MGLANSHRYDFGLRGVASWAWQANRYTGSGSTGGYRTSIPAYGRRNHGKVCGKPHPEGVKRAGTSLRRKPIF